MRLPAMLSYDSQRPLFITVGVVAFFIFLLSTAPARLLFQLVPGDAVGVAGVEGTLWNGSASRLSVAGFSLKSTRWNINPWSLFTGKLQSHLITSWEGGEFEGDIAVGFLGALYLNDAIIFADLGTVTQGVQLPVAGQLNLQATSVVIEDQWPTRVIANAEVRNLMVSQPGGGGVPSELGDYAAVFDNPEVSEELPLAAAINDTRGPLKLAGTLKLTPPSGYRIEASIKPDASAPAQLKQALKFMAPLDNQGNHKLEFESSF